MNYRAIIFDLDGTLLDTLEDIADSMNLVLGSFGFPRHSLESYKTFVGDGMEALVDRCLPETHRNTADLKKYVAAMRDAYAKRWANKTHPYEDIPEVLDALTSRGIKLSVLSNKPDEFAKAMVAKFLPFQQFEIVWGSTPSMPKKPDPRAAVEIAERIKIPPPRVLFLGDSGVDMETAKAAGMYPVGVLWGFRSEGELRASGAQALLAKPTDLSKLL